MRTGSAPSAAMTDREEEMTIKKSPTPGRHQANGQGTSDNARRLRSYSTSLWLIRQLPGEWRDWWICELSYRTDLSRTTALATHPRLHEIDTPLPVWWLGNRRQVMTEVG